MEPVNAGATVVAPSLSAQHPLEGLGLDTNNPEASALLEMMGDMPGASEANAAAQVAADQRFTQQPDLTPQIIRGQMPTGPTPVEPTQQAKLPAPVNPADAFNKQFEAIQPGAEPVKQDVPDEDVQMTRDDYDFLVGLIQDQGVAIQGYVGGQTAVPGPSSIPVNTIVTPGFQPTPEQAGPQVAPLAVPEITKQDISEAQFEKMTTDRSEMAAFLHERDKTVAATVTEQLAATVLPTVYAHINKQMESQRAIDGFLQSNPDLAAHPKALHAAVQEARAQLPYANVDRLLYYAAQRLRGAMGANEAINTSVHDHRGPVRGRRAPVINSQRVNRAGGQDLANVNPFDVMKADMLRRAQPGQGDILRDLGMR